MAMWPARLPSWPGWTVTRVTEAAGIPHLTRWTVMSAVGLTQP